MLSSNSLSLVILSFLLIAPIKKVTAQEIHSIHCWTACPSGVNQSNDVIFREIYTLSSNDETKLADWVAYVVRVENFDSGGKTARVWAADPWLGDAETLEPDDYKGANAALGTDRGHQAPLASFRSTKYWSYTNYLSNITPQDSDLNQGPWLQLENQERAWARDGFEVYVLTGPIHGKLFSRLPAADEEHSVPEGYWKSITLIRSGQKEGERNYLMPQSADRKSNYADWISSVERIESVTGLDLYPERDN